MTNQQIEAAERVRAGLLQMARGILQVSTAIAVVCDFDLTAAERSQLDLTGTKNGAPTRESAHRR